MNTSTAFSLNFEKVIEQAERELRCEQRDGCTNCSACVANKSAHNSAASSSLTERIAAAAVSTD